MKKGTKILFWVLSACSVLGIIASVLGWRKKASAISIIGGADGPTSIFYCGKNKLYAGIFANSTSDSCSCGDGSGNQKTA